MNFEQRKKQVESKTAVQAEPVRRSFMCCAVKNLYHMDKKPAQKVTSSQNV